MQSLRSFGVLSLFFSMALFIMACGGNAAAGEQETANQTEEMTSEATADTTATEATAGTEAAHGEGKEYTSAYVCPMHCTGSGSDEAGKCPVCGMDYVALADHTSDEHKH